MLHQRNCYNKMKNTKYNTVGTIPKFNRTFVERIKIVGGVKIDTTNTQIHDQSQFVSDLLQGWWFCLGTQVSSTNKTDCTGITEILWKVVLNTITTKPLGPKDSNLIGTLVNWYFTKLLLLSGTRDPSDCVTFVSILIKEVILLSLIEFIRQIKGACLCLTSLKSSSSGFIWNETYLWNVEWGWYKW